MRKPKMVENNEVIVLSSDDDDYNENIHHNIEINQRREDRTNRFARMRTFNFRNFYETRVQPERENLSRLLERLKDYIRETRRRRRRVRRRIVSIERRIRETRRVLNQPELPLNGATITVLISCVRDGRRTYTCERDQFSMLMLADVRENCCVCYENASNTTLQKIEICGHVVCRRCMEELLDNWEQFDELRCPMCRCKLFNPTRRI